MMTQKQKRLKFCKVQVILMVMLLFNFEDVFHIAHLSVF